MDVAANGGGTSGADLTDFLRFHTDINLALLACVTLTNCVLEKIQVTDAWLSTKNEFFRIMLGKPPTFGSNSPDTKASETAPDMTS